MEKKVPRRHTPEFKKAAVERMEKGEGVSALARELNIRRKLLYDWRNQLRAGPKPEPFSKEIELQRSKMRVQQLEQLAGRQADAIDFLQRALRAVERSRPSQNSGEERSSAPSKK